MMSTITAKIWDLLKENGQLHDDLTDIMQQTYEPFMR
jgi:hypothetical protein